MRRVTHPAAFESGQQLCHLTSDPCPSSPPTTLPCHLYRPCHLHLFNPFSPRFQSPCPPPPLLLTPPPPKVLAVGDFNIAASRADVHPAINYDTMYADEERALMAELLQVRGGWVVCCIAGRCTTEKPDAAVSKAPPHITARSMHSKQCGTGGDNPAHGVVPSTFAAVQLSSAPQLKHSTCAAGCP